jgi:hypothetical protein
MITLRGAGTATAFDVEAWGRVSVGPSSLLKQR